MLSATSPPERAPRFAPSRKHALTLTLESTGAEAAITATGKLLDLSPGGAKVLLDAPLRFQQALMLRLQSQQLQLYLALAARVCWIRSSGDHWQLGCSFDPALPEEDIQRLLSNGVLDRRRNERESINRPATALWELNPQATPVMVVDLSRGGFCLRSPLPAEPNSGLRLQATGADGAAVEASATVQWRLKLPEGYLLGCSMPSVESHHALLTTLLSPAPEPPQPRSRRMWWYMLFAAACVGAIKILPWL